jgi:hypothetical protein
MSDPHLRARQELIRALLEEGRDRGCPSCGRGAMDSGIAPMLALLEQSLQVNRDDLRAERGPTPRSDCCAKRPTCGVFVLLMGDLGNYPPRSARTFRFAVADPGSLPSMRHATWSFTLPTNWRIFAHRRQRWRGDADVERFCNLVAGEFLLPTAELQAIPRSRWQDSDATAGLISEFAARRNQAVRWLPPGCARPAPSASPPMTG